MSASARALAQKWVGPPRCGQRRGAARAGRPPPRAAWPGRRPRRSPRHRCRDGGLDAGRI